MLQPLDRIAKLCVSGECTPKDFETCVDAQCRRESVRISKFSTNTVSELSITAKAPAPERHVRLKLTQKHPGSTTMAGKISVTKLYPY